MDEIMILWLRTMYRDVFMWNRIKVILEYKKKCYSDDGSISKIFVEVFKMII